MNQYYYYNGRQNVGPMPLADLKAQPITPDTLVWYEGLPDWKKASELPELMDRFGPATTSQATPQGSYQPQQQYNHYAQFNTPSNVYSSGGLSKAPAMGALKVFSIISLLASIIMFVLGFAVADLRASGCWSYDCYPYVSGNEELGVAICIISLLFLTTSIIAMVKAFKRYV